jgi:serine/threonine protein phosphatase 1
MFSRKPAAQPASAQTVMNELRPDAAFYAVGDIHGCDVLLAQMITKLELGRHRPVVFLGDYIDRGPQSAQVLARLFDLSQTHPANVICLMGNHERMLCDFIDDPLENGALWLRNGGLETMESFGVSGPPRHADADALIDAADALEAALGKDLFVWLRALPLSWHSGNVWCVHAAMNPARSPQTQRTQSLLWGHRDFLGSPREDGLCIVHGHTIVPQPLNANSRIAIDTGAYRGGGLTAALIGPDQCDFVTVQ